MPAPVSLSPCWFQAEPERVNTHAAPLLPKSLYPPMRAVLPSAESATLRPNRVGLTAPPPMSLTPCWLQVVPARVYTQAAPLLSSSA